MSLDFWEQIYKLDISRQQQSSGRDTAEMILGVKQSELHCRGASWVTSYQVTKLSEYVATNLDHVLMDSLCL